MAAAGIAGAIICVKLALDERALQTLIEETCAAFRRFSRAS
jgi:hypothetical protein